MIGTTSGDVVGCTPGDGRVSRFLGIPFAEPTYGARRFRRTERYARRVEPLDAFVFGPASAHLYDPNEGTLADFGEAESDPQCFHVGTEGPLTLNIWTPAPDRGKRPVLVFIHGGANWVGTSRLPLYHGDRFCERGDVVFVSFNYRLGLLGFMEFGWLGGRAYEGSHANGLRDQLAALEWIHANIGAFGGDPDNVTVMGESAGSSNITWLIATGRLGGLAKRVVLMSGAGGNSLRYDWTLEGGCAAARKVMALAGLETMAQLLRLTTEELLERHRRAFRALHIFEQSMFTPRVDGDFIASSPFEYAARGAASQLDVLIGYTGFEMGLYLLYDPELDRRTCAEHLSSMRLVHEQKNAIRELYNKAYAAEAPGVRGMHLVSDIWFVMPSLILAETLAAHSANVWVYEFAWQNPRSRLRAGHALDLPFWFDKLELQQSQFLLGEPQGAAEVQERVELASRMQDALLAFARAGNPATSAMPWPPYDRDRRLVQMLDGRPEAVSDPRAQTRQWWCRHQDLITGIRSPLAPGADHGNE